MESEYDEIPRKVSKTCIAWLAQSIILLLMAIGLVLTTGNIVDLS